MCKRFKELRVEQYRPEEQKACNLGRSRLNTQDRLRSLIQDKHESSANTSESVCNETLVHTCCNALLGRNLLEAIESPLINMLLRWLLSLHLQATAHSIEWITDCRTSDDRSLRRGECAHNTQHARVILVWIQPHERVKGTQLKSPVRDDAGQ